MKSRTSSCKSAIIFNNLKRFWWISVLYTIILFLIGPLWILNKDINQIMRTATLDIETFQNMTLVIICFIAVIVGTMIFRYLQNSKSVTLLHSMPISRGGLYISNFISGIILLFAPILVIALIIFEIKYYTVVGTFIDEVALWNWLGMSLLLTTSIYSITVMVGMFTGSSIAQIIFTYILNFLPAAITLGINYLLIGVIYGLGEMSGTTFENISNWMPITQIAATRELKEVWLINTIYIVAAMVIGYLVYRSRNLENSGDVISNKVLRPIFKYGVTFCAMGLGVIYTKVTFEIYEPNLLIYIIFALLGYVIAEMLLRKSFKIWDSYKGFIGYIGVLVVTAIIINMGTFGYETRIPKVEDIEYAVIGDYVDIEYLENAANYKDTYFYRTTIILNQQEGIEKVKALHEKIIKDRKFQNNGATHIVYKLKNGNFIKRTYFISRYNDYQTDFYGIYNLEEYKKDSNMVFRIAPQDFSDLVIRAKNNNGDVMINNREEIAKITDMVKQSILNTSYEDRVKDGPVYYIEFRWKPEDSDFVDYYQVEADNKITTLPQKAQYRSETIGIGTYDTEILEYFNKMGYTRRTGILVL